MNYQHEYHTNFSVVIAYYFHLCNGFVKFFNVVRQESPYLNSGL